MTDSQPFDNLNASEDFTALWLELRQLFARRVAVELLEEWPHLAQPDGEEE